MRDRSYPKTKEKADAVSQDEIDRIRDEARQAQELLDNPYLIHYLDTLKKEILDIHTKQLLYDEKTEREIQGGKKIIDVPSQKEYLILAGQYRLAEQIIVDMNQSVEIGKELEKRIKDETLEVASE
jgi:hypothetical protein